MECSCSLPVDASVLLQDTTLALALPDLSDQLANHPESTLNAMALALHTVSRFVEGKFTIIICYGSYDYVHQLCTCLLDISMHILCEVGMLYLYIVCLVISIERAINLSRHLHS